MPFFIRTGKRLPVTATKVLARLRCPPEPIWNAKRAGPALSAVQAQPGHHPRRGKRRPAIVSSHLDATAKVLGLDKAAFDAVIDELCPISRLFTDAKLTVNATLESNLWTRTRSACPRAPTGRSASEE